MGNTIKKDTVLIIAETLVDSEAFKTGETIVHYKGDGYFIYNDGTGKKWGVFLRRLRDERYYRIVNQYSISDIICYLQKKNEDYLTVMRELLAEAVRTAVNSIRISSLDDIYNYVAENLI